MVVDVSASKKIYITNPQILHKIKTQGKHIGQGKVIDYVYGSANFDEELLFVRKVVESLWPSMTRGKFYPFLKTQINWQDGFETSKVTLGSPLVECNRLEEAATILGSSSTHLFWFNRTISEYKVGDLTVYIEDIDHLPQTLEVISRNPKLSLEQNRELVSEFLKSLNTTYSLKHQVATLVRSEIGR